MSDSNSTSLINLGDLTKPATVLIEKISDAIGGLFKPHQIISIAKAEAEAEKIRAVAKVEIDELQRRALIRFVSEETKKQANIEAITIKTIEGLKEESRPQDIEDDWIANFFEKCRLISDEEMQSLWAKVLSGEANRPGTYSKITINFLSSLDKSDATIFTEVCSFGWHYSGSIIPLVYSFEDEIYQNKGISFETLKHLDDIGLVSFPGISSFNFNQLPKVAGFVYYKSLVYVSFEHEVNNVFDCGKVLFTKIGQELALICGAQPDQQFFDYILAQWLRKGYITYSDWPKINVSIS